MITVPLQINDTAYDLCIILEDDNIARLKNYDPAEVRSEALGSFSQLFIRNIHLFYASAEEIRHISGCKTMGEIAGAIRNLGRGFKYNPKLGDNDSAYQSLKGN